MIQDTRGCPDAVLGSRSVSAATDFVPPPGAPDLDRSAVEEKRVRRVAQQIAHYDTAPAVVESPGVTTGYDPVTRLSR